jgi:hypothetical protein
VSASRLTVTGTVNTAVADATIYGDDSNFCPATTVELYADAEGATTFTWYQDGEQVQRETYSEFSVTSSGSYTVQGENANCTGITSSTKEVTISACCTYCGGATWTSCSSTTAQEYYYYDGQNVWSDGTRNGFTMISNVQYEGNGKVSWQDAYALCDRKGAGWRLPTYEELLCMCIKKNNFIYPVPPGGYVYGEHWSSSWAHNQALRPYYLNPANDVCGNLNNYDLQTGYVKCVK